MTVITRVSRDTPSNAAVSLTVKSRAKPVNVLAARERALSLADAIAARTDLARADILGRTRTALLVAARHQLFADLWREGYGIAEIGRILGRDHTTIAHGLRRALGDEAYLRELADRYPDLAKGRPHRFAKCEPKRDPLERTG